MRKGGKFGFLQFSIAAHARGKEREEREEEKARDEKQNPNSCRSFFYYSYLPLPTNYFTAELLLATTCHFATTTFCQVYIYIYDYQSCTRFCVHCKYSHLHASKTNRLYLAPKTNQHEKIHKPFHSPLLSPPTRRR